MIEVYCPECGVCMGTGELGAHLGYPECCQESFADRSVLWDMAERLGIEDQLQFTDLALDGSGFIPCYEHDVMAHHEGDLALVDMINERRECIVAFRAPKESE